MGGFKSLYYLTKLYIIEIICHIFQENIFNNTLGICNFKISYKVKFTLKLAKALLINEETNSSLYFWIAQSGPEAFKFNRAQTF